MSFIFLLLAFNMVAAADSFEADSKNLAMNLKQSLVKELTQKIKDKGTTEAVMFCQANVGVIAKSAAKDYLGRYEFGRTSHKWRNEKNAPTDWMSTYLSKYQGKKKDDIRKATLIHRLPDGKRVYLEPLFVQPLCLQCHGESLRPEVKEKISQLFSKDKATGFKLNEFRGFIWVKEK